MKPSSEEYYYKSGVIVGVWISQSV